MERLIYYSGEETSGDGGVSKKIRNQIKAFRNNGINAEWNIVYRKKKLLRILPFSSSFQWGKLQTPDVDYIYIRWEPESYPFIRFLGRIRKKNPACKIIMEIGTYPYEKELKKFSNPVTIIRNKIYRTFLKKYIDLITIYTDFDSLFGIRTLKLVNTIDVRNVITPKRLYYRNDNVINVIAVASIAYYYGFDRFIRGLSAYYKSDHPYYKVYLHLVGQSADNSNTLDELKELCKNLDISQYVIFYGFRSGKDLDDIYEKADIGIDVLGGHRKGDIWFGTLKSREYMCKGIPFITEYPLPNEIAPIKKYILNTPADESDIDIQHIVDFFLSIKDKESRKDVIDNMRNFAMSYCDISVAMNPVINFFRGNVE